MITAEELNGIYDKGFETDGPGPKDKPAPKKMASVEDLDKGSAFAFTRSSAYDPREYNNYLKAGLFEQKGNPDLQRGEAQSAWDKWGNMTARILPKIGLGLVEGVGYLGALATEWGDDRDYSNALTEAAKAGQDWVDSKFPLYRRTEGTWGLTDAAWWAENLGGLVESASTFAIGGMGVGSILSKVGSLAKATRMGVKGLRAVNKAVEIGTSATLAYAEGAMMGKGVYDKAYEAQMRKGIAAGLSYEEADANAKHIAAQSAATTVQLNVMINTGLNLEMLSGVFAHKNADAIQKYWKQNGKDLKGETFESFAHRIRTGTNITDKAVAKQVFKHQGAGHYLKSSVAEGIEELTNQFAEKTGEQLGQQWDGTARTGRTKGLFEQLGELNHYFDRTMDSEGGLSFALGMLGGLGQSGLIDNIAAHKTNVVGADGKYVPVMVKDEKTGKETPLVDPQGNPVYEQKRVSARIRTKYNDTAYFNNVRDAIISDVGRIEDIKGKISKARAAGHHDQADAYADELFNAMQYSAVQMGMAGNYTETFRQLGAADNTTAFRDAELKPQIEFLNEAIAMETDPGQIGILEKIRDALQAEYDAASTDTAAMQAGLAQDMDDNAYKDKANEAIDSLKNLESIHNRVQARVGGSNDPGIERMATIIGNREMEAYSQGKRIERLQKEVDAMKAEQRQRLDDIGIDLDLPGLNTEIVEFNQKLQVSREMQERLLAEARLIEKAGKILETNPNHAESRAVVDNAIAKYKLIDEANPAADVQALANRLAQRAITMQEEDHAMDEAVRNSIGYAQWLKKNPDGTFAEFGEKVRDKHSLSESQLRKEAFLESQKILHKEMTARLAEIETARGLKKLHTMSEDLQKEFVRMSTEERVKRAIADQKEAQTALAAAQNQLRSLQRLQKKYGQKLVLLQQRLEGKILELDLINRQLRSFIKDGSTVLQNQFQVEAWSNLNLQRAQVEKSIEQIESTIAKINSLFETVSVQASNLAAQLEIPEEVTKKPDNDTEEADATKTDTVEDEIIVPEPPDPDELMKQAAEEPEVVVPPVAVNLMDLKDAFQYEVGMIRDKEVREAVLALEKEHLQTGAPVSLDALLPYVTSKQIAADQAGRVLLALNEYLAGAQDVLADINQGEQAAAEALNLADQAVDNTQMEETEDDTRDDSSGIVIGPNSMVTMNDEELDPTLEDDGSVSHAGTKTMSAIAIRTLSIDFVHFKDPVTGDYTKHTLIGKLNPNIHPDMLTPGKLKAGEALFLEVDTAYKGTVNTTNQLANDEYGMRGQEDEDTTNYMDDAEDIKNDGSYENVPIKITNAAGETLGHLTRMKWLTDSYEGAEGDEKYNNVVRYIYGPNGEVTDNFANQVRSLRDVRRAIVQQYNKNRSKIETHIDNVGPGMLVMNTRINLNTEQAKMKTFDSGVQVQEFVRERASKLLPDKSLTLAVVERREDGGVRVVDGWDPLTNQSHKSNLPMVKEDKELEKFAGMPIALLPGTNGAMHVAPLFAQRIFDANGGQSTFNTLVRVMEVFIGANSENSAVKDEFKAEVKKILDGTGFDVSTEDGLRQFIEQHITYTTQFTDSMATATSNKDGKSSLDFVLKVENRSGAQSRGSIKIGTLYSGKGVRQATLKNGKLDPEFVHALREGLGGRYRSVTFPKGEQMGIGSEGEFRSPKIKSNGVWEFKKYDSYNDFVKDVTTTYVVGTHQLPSGQYVYAVSPQITLNEQKITESLEMDVIETTLPDPGDGTDGPAVSDEYAEELFSMFDELNFDKPMMTPKIVNKSGQQLLNNTPLTIKALTQLYNFTAEAHRNGKSVSRVFEDMKRLGIPYLVEGYNPFSKCI